MTFWSRSDGIVDCVWVTGIVLPGGSTGPYSARLAVDEVLADQRLWARLAERVGVEVRRTRSGSRATVTSAWQSPRVPARQAGGRLIDVIVPARTPATLKSAPVTRPKALSNSIRYVPVALLSPVAAPETIAKRAPRRSTARPARILLMGRSGPGSGYTGSPASDRRERRAPPIRGSGRPGTRSGHRPGPVSSWTTLVSCWGTRQRAQQRAVGGREDAQRRRDAARATVGVDRAGVREPLEPPGQVDRVGAGGGELGGEVVERDRGLRERSGPPLPVAR